MLRRIESLLENFFNPLGGETVIDSNGFRRFLKVKPTHPESDTVVTVVYPNGTQATRFEHTASQTPADRIIIVKQ